MVSEKPRPHLVLSSCKMVYWTILIVKFSKFYQFRACHSQTQFSSIFLHFFISNVHGSDVHVCDVDGDLWLVNFETILNCDWSDNRHGTQYWTLIGQLLNTKLWLVNYWSSQCAPICDRSIPELDYVPPATSQYLAQLSTCLAQHHLDPSLEYWEQFWRWVSMISSFSNARIQT